MGLKGLAVLIEHHEHLLRVVGGFFLVGFGIHTLVSKASGEVRRPIHERNLWIAYFSTIGLTMAYPLTLMGLVFVSAAAGVGVREFSVGKTALIVGGIFCGSAIWWLTLSTSAAWLGQKLGGKTFHLINRTAGTVLLVVGLFQIGTLVGRYFL
jgi:arginine exporter protein ArgO